MKKNYSLDKKRIYSLFLGILTVAISLIICSASTSVSTSIETGEYFIVNAKTDEAITPVSTGVNSNAYLSKFKKSGLQKWTITKKVAKLKSGKTSTSYTIMNSASAFYLRPYFVPDNHGAIISSLDNNSIFTIDGEAKECVIKSKAMGGDAMYGRRENPSNEVWFADVEEENDSFKWKLISAK